MTESQMPILQQPIVEMEPWVAECLKRDWKIDEIPGEIARLHLEIAPRLDLIQSNNEKIEDLKQKVNHQQSLAALGKKDEINKDVETARRIRSENHSINREIQDRNVAIEFLRLRFPILAVEHESEKLGQRQAMVVNVHSASENKG